MGWTHIVIDTLSALPSLPAVVTGVPGGSCPLPAGNLPRLCRVSMAPWLAIQRLCPRVDGLSASI